MSTCRLISLKFITIASNRSLTLTSSQNIFHSTGRLFHILFSRFQFCLPTAPQCSLSAAGFPSCFPEKTEENFHSSHPPPGICTHVFRLAAWYSRQTDCIPTKAYLLYLCNSFHYCHLLQTHNFPMLSPYWVKASLSPHPTSPLGDNSHHHASILF